MSHKVIRLLLTMPLILACSITSAVARAGEIDSPVALRRPPPVVHGEPTPLTLAYTHGRALPRGMRLDVTPAVVVARDKRNLGTILGYSGTVELNACGDLIVVAGKVASREWNDRVTAEWSVGVTLGSELQLPGKAIARHMLSRVRSVLVRVL